MAADLPAGVTEVGRIPGDAPGSYWVLGSDGGVFAIGGASFFGAYTDLESRGFGAQDPGRSFQGGVAGIVANGTGGYTIHDRDGNAYDFNPERQEVDTTVETTEPATQAPAAIPEYKPSTVGGEAILTQALKEYGLEGMAGDLLAYLRGEGAGSVDATYLKMRDDPRYKARFKGMAGRAANDYDPIDEETYVRWEGQTRSLFDHYSIPKEFYDSQEELDAFIAGDVSVAELKERIVNGYNAVFTSPPETLQALQSMYGIDAGHVAAFFLDPTKGEEIIQKRWVATQIGTQAMKTGFGGLTAAEGERLATGGVTGKEAQGVFGMLQQADQLTTDFTREEKLGVVAGDEAAKSKLQTAAQRKRSVFEAGGTFASEREGITGLGTAND
jgi:hypothetical protein